MSVTAPLPPAPLVPDAARTTYVRAAVTILRGEVHSDAGRDTEKLERAVRAALEAVEIIIDLTDSFPAVDKVPAAITQAVVWLAAGELVAPGFAYGAVGYEPTDPAAVRTYGAVRFLLTPGHKARFGLA